ncbi:hypothetical protein F511_26045 [Dorcoceras hygrometricum]|uniref:Uncharacterized protein n=1 Tax=Dorcoceras hygrometricum TaxID=472368 RepID=A0A2Z7CXZ1_9LAMI|nr:hypothetical protein F511_26045 [Dorcoceras hygrometricum]
MLTQKLTLAEERTHRLFSKASKSSSFAFPLPAQYNRLKRVANERAMQGESSATKISKNRGWMRRETAVEKSRSKQKAFARKHFKTTPFQLIKTTPKQSPADNSSRKQNDHLLITALSFQNISSAGREKSLKTTTHLLIQTTSLWLRKHCYQQLISQTKSSKRSVSTNSNDAASQHSYLRACWSAATIATQTTTSSKEYVTPTSSYLSIALATDSTNHQLITVHKRLC